MSNHPRAIRALLILMPFLSPLPSRAGQPASTDSISDAALSGHVHFLASDALGGRCIGSPGYVTAVHYAESQFRAAGLVPVVSESKRGTYLQEVPVHKRTTRGALKLVVHTPDGDRVFVEGTDLKWFQGETFPVEGREAPVVFGGYGIHEPEAGWDDFQNIEVRGKMVIIMMGAPESDGAPVLPEAKHALYAPPSAVMRKLVTMFFRGAAGVLVLPNPEIMQAWDLLESKTTRPQFAYGVDDPGALHVPGLWIMRPELAEALFVSQDRAPTGLNLDVAETTTSFELDNVWVKLDASFQDEPVSSWNVVGLVEGIDPILRDEYVVVSAHLDSAIPSEEGQITNGADDDASGCAAVIEIARAIAAKPLKRSVLFVLFAGEEVACVGSRHFVTHCPVDRDAIVADVHLDMIGRTDPASAADRSHYAVDSDKVTPELKRLLQEVNDRTVRWPLKYDCVTGNSDNLMFQAFSIPAVCFYSGHHADVNEPTDDVEKLDFEKMQRVSQLAYELTKELGKRDLLWP